MMLVEDYKLLRRRLLSEVPELKLVEFYAGQGEPESKGNIMATPAAYIQFGDLDLKRLGKKKLETAVTFEVILFVTNLKEGEARAGDFLELNTYSMQGALLKALEGFSARLSNLIEYSSLADTTQDYKVINSIECTKQSRSQELQGLQRSVLTFKYYKQINDAQRPRPIVPKPTLAILTEL